MRTMTYRWARGSGLVLRTVHGSDGTGPCHKYIRIDVQGISIVPKNCQVIISTSQFFGLFDDASTRCRLQFLFVDHIPPPSTQYRPWSNNPGECSSKRPSSLLWFIVAPWRRLFNAPARDFPVARKKNVFLDTCNKSKQTEHGITTEMRSFARKGIVHSKRKKLVFIQRDQKRSQETKMNYWKQVRTPIATWKNWKHSWQGLLLQPKLFQYEN
jgi:hypothetical protein